MTGCLIPALGTMTLTGGYGAISSTQAFSVLTHAVDQGVALLDTADAYPGGEPLVASVRAATERPVRIVTKVGLRGRPGHRMACGRPSYLRQACDASLRRLGGERLDILLLHRVDPEVPVEESMAALGGLIEAGKVAEIGLCTGDPQLLRRAAAAAPVWWVQTAVSVLAPAMAGLLLPVVRELGATLLAHSPLHRGLVVRSRDPGSTTVDDARAYIPEMTAHERSLAREFRKLAHDHQTSAVDLALGWLTSLGPDVVPIPGARTCSQVTQNLHAQRKVLSDDQTQAVSAFVREAGFPNPTPRPQASNGSWRYRHN